VQTPTTTSLSIRAATPTVGASALWVIITSRTLHRITTATVNPDR
jgi:hypothetical protein